MAGIVSFGACVPFWRLDESMIAQKLKGERPVAGFDVIMIGEMTGSLNAAVPIFGRKE